MSLGSMYLHSLVLYIDGGAAVTGEHMMRETYRFYFSYIWATVRAYSSFSHFTINKHISAGTGLNVPVLKQHYCHLGVHGTRLDVPVLDTINTSHFQPTTLIHQLIFQRSTFSFSQLGKTMPDRSSYFSLRFTPTVKQENTTALSHSELL